jgi:DNA polymerase III subunit epsilon
LPANITVNTIDELKYRLTPYAENDYIRGLIYQHASRYPSKKIVLNN